jgi:hypothetical protein
MGSQHSWDEIIAPLDVESLLFLLTAYCSGGLPAVMGLMSMLPLCQTG